MCRVVAYYRVSTAEQGRSGLGIEAQRQAVRQLCEARGWEVIDERTEVESGKTSNRPQLAAALHHAKVTGATLVVAKLDRLSRSVAFLSALQDSGAKFVAADMPEANDLTVHIMAAVAQAEREAISKRTKDALRAAKAAGRKLGNPNGAAALHRAGKGNSAAVEKVKAGANSYAQDLAPVIADIRASGVTSLGGIAAELNARHIQTRRGGKWHASSVRNLLARLA
ncbi:recombinase family protein [Erythrobacter sp.]|uniref:recombinase family protein n=1 Tax=Erythrobacter sp. TaxID=1042 RepID=UPI001426014A|nr:recombinase family protein [Erythrobacter sp.]QIQ87074.1 MAG: recombinase family protein [Erythrobacter sp.]